MEEKEATNEKNLSDLHEFLAKKEENKAREEKPKALSTEEIGKFYQEIVIPAFKTLKQELTKFNFEAIDYYQHTVKSYFKVSETLSQFFFKIEISNTQRTVHFYEVIRYRTEKRGKLTEIPNAESKNISFNEIKTITQETIISVFTQWFMAKDEKIEKYINYLEHKT